MKKRRLIDFCMKGFKSGLSLIFILLLSVVFGVAVDVSEPSGLWVVEGNETIIIKEGSQVIVDLEINFTGPVPLTTLLEGEIGNNSESELFVDVLDYQGISYISDEGSYSVSNSSDLVNLVFNAAGEHTIYILVQGPDDEFEQLEMDIVGTNVGSNYPKLPSIDFGADGTVEWQHFGDLVGFLSDYSKPDGLDENQKNLEIEINNETDNYYCESINMPYGRDFEIYVNLKKVFSGDGPEMRATILQLSSPGSNTAYGGADECEFDLAAGGTEFEYYSCALNSSYAIQGAYLVCIYNFASGGEYDGHVLLRADDSDESAYVCEESGSDYNCDDGAVGDFFIKLKGGEYSEILDGAADFDEGLINNYEFFLKSLDDSIDNCKEITNGGTGCVVPIKIMSEGAGIISLQNLDMKYESSGSVLTTDKFYLTYESGEGVIEKIKGVSLYDAEDGKVIAITTEGLFLPAPFVSDEKLYNLSIGLNPGPSTSVEVLIEPFGGSIYNETTALRAVDEYITFFTDLQSESGALLDLFGLSGDVSNVLDDLQKILIEINSVSSMNLTETEKQEKLENITSGLSDELDGLVKTLPRSVRVVDKVEDVAVVEPSDVLDSMISNGEEERMQVYYHQEDFTVGIVGEYVEVEFFDDSSVEGTIVTKNINGRGSGYSVFESIPNFIATSSEISLDGFSLVESGGFNVYKKDYDSLSGVSYSYFVQGNVVAGLSDLKTVLVPKSGVVAGHDEVAVCGDGKCAVLLVDGEKIYLEDETSCPEDCASKVNWSGIFLVFMIGVLIVVAVAVYLRFLGKGSKKIKSKGVVDKAMLFSSENDEKNLRDYVAKALESGMDREKVNDVLLKRGWSKEQIDYVFGKK